MLIDLEIEQVSIVLRILLSCIKKWAKCIQNSMVACDTQLFALGVKTGYKLGQGEVVNLRSHSNWLNFMSLLYCFLHFLLFLNSICLNNESIWLSFKCDKLMLSELKSLWEQYPTHSLLISMLHIVVCIFILSYSQQVFGIIVRILLFSLILVYALILDQTNRLLFLVLSLFSRSLVHEPRRWPRLASCRFQNRVYTQSKEKRIQARRIFYNG